MFRKTNCKARLSIRAAMLASCAFALTACSSGLDGDGAPVKSPINNVDQPTIRLGASGPIRNVDDLKAVLSGADLGAAVNAMNSSIQLWQEPSAISLMRDIWEDRRESHPSLNWGMLVSSRFRVALAGTLGQIDAHARPDCYEYVLVSVNSTDTRTRADAIRTVGILGSEKDIPALAELSKSEQPIFAMSAIAGLAFIGTPNAIAAIQAVASDSSISAVIRSMAGETLNGLKAN